MAESLRDADAIARLRALLSYDAEVGVFRWKAKPSKRVMIGSVAGSPTATGHLRIEVCGVRYWAHHLAWLFVYGEWPADIIDHRDGRPENNRIDNLRIADASKNIQNSKIYRTNSSGLKGVSFCGQTKKWRAAITKDGHYYNLGRFASAEAAHAAYLRAANQMFGEFARAA